MFYLTSKCEDMLSKVSNLKENENCPSILKNFKLTGITARISIKNIPVRISLFPYW